VHARLTTALSRCGALRRVHALAPAASGVRKVCDRAEDQGRSREARYDEQPEAYLYRLGTASGSG
jgi:hypothetical protein